MNKKMIYRISGFTLFVLYFVLVGIFANSEYIKANPYCETFLPFVLGFCLIGGIVFFVLGFRKNKKSGQLEITYEIACGIVKRTEKLKNVALILLGIGLLLVFLGFINKNIAKVGVVFFIIGVYMGIFVKESKKYKEAKKHLELCNQREIKLTDVTKHNGSELKNEKVITTSLKSHEDKLAKHIMIPKCKSKTDAIEILRSEILNEITENKSMKIELASLLWGAAAKCFPTDASWNWDGAWFKLDLITKRLYVEVSTYPNQFGACHEDEFSISADEFNRIANEYDLAEKLKFLQTDEDWDMIFDENLKAIISDTQKTIQQEKEERQLKERMQNAVVLPDGLENRSPSMELRKVRIRLNQRYGASDVDLIQINGEYRLHYYSHFRYSPDSRSYRRKLSLQEAFWVEEQIDAAFRNIRNKDKTTWQSKPDGDTMEIVIERLRGENINMPCCMPLNKYMDLLHNLEKLAQYGSCFK